MVGWKTPRADFTPREAFSGRCVAGVTRGLINLRLGQSRVQFPHLPFFILRLAAKISISRAHVTGLDSSAAAAFFIKSFSDSDRGIFIPSVRLSSVFLGGRPVLM